MVLSAVNLSEIQTFAVFNIFIWSYEAVVVNTNVECLLITTGVEFHLQQLIVTTAEGEAVFLAVSIVPSISVVLLLQRDRQITAS